MHFLAKPVLFLGCLMAASAAQAAERTVTLKVEGMTCASCIYIVKKSLAAVDGVATVDVFFGEKTAVVTFDDAKTGTAALTQATAGMGFPSQVARPAQ